MVAEYTFYSTPYFVRKVFDAVFCRRCFGIIWVGLLFASNFLLGDSLIAKAPKVTLVTVEPKKTEFQKILDYQPQKDADAKYKSGSKGLAQTVFNPALKVNQNALVDHARVMPLVLGEAWHGQLAQGSSSARALIFSQWQYIDRIVRWGGTWKRNVTAPGQAWIDVAHRNGVKIYGNVFIAPSAYGGNIEQVVYLTQVDEQGRFVVADKLIEIAESQGFDGWFLNQEVQGADAELAERVGKFMEYIQAKSDIELIWYDSMTESGWVRWQEELNERNDRFFQHNGKLVSEAIFLDFTPDPYGLTNSILHANQLGRSEYDVYAGALLERDGIAGSASGMNWAFNSVLDGKHATSVSLFRPDKGVWQAYKRSDWDIQAMIDGDSQLYVGGSGDPSDTSDPVPGTNWQGIAHYIAAKTPLLRDRFISNFNYGIGTDYYIEGKKLSTQDWNNIGAQDVLPTWRWVFQSDSSTSLAAQFDFSDAFYGGSSLKISGKSGQTTDMPLFLTAIDVHDDSKLVVTYKTDKVGPAPFAAFITLRGEDSVRVPLGLGETTSAEWESVELDISAHASKQISSIGLRFAGQEDSDFQVNIGQIGIIRGERDLIAPPTKARVEQSSVVGDTGELRVVWEHSEDYSRDFAKDEVYYYNVFQELADKSHKFLGVTGGSGLYIANLQREAEFDSTKILVQAVGIEFGTSPMAEVTFSWLGESQ